MDRRGFTLVELLVVLAVGSILLAIAVPGYGYLLKRRQIDDAHQRSGGRPAPGAFRSDQRGTRVTLCKPAAPRPHRRPAIQRPTGSRAGWFSSMAEREEWSIRANAVVWVRDRTSGEATITTSNYGSYISYLPNGKSQGMNNLAMATSYLRRGQPRDIIINTTGRPRTRLQHLLSAIPGSSCPHR